MWIINYEDIFSFSSHNLELIETLAAIICKWRTITAYNTFYRIAWLEKCKYLVVFYLLAYL